MKFITELRAEGEIIKLVVRDGKIHLYLRPNFNDTTSKVAVPTILTKEEIDILVDELKQIQKVL